MYVLPAWPFAVLLHIAPHPFTIMLTAYNQDKQKYLRYLHGTQKSPRFGREEEVRTTPLFSLSIQHRAEDEYHSDGKPPVLPQYGLLGFNVGTTEGIDPEEAVLMNVAAPNSTFICGSQGSGKSYSLAVMLESCLIRNDDTGMLQSALAGLVFHYDIDASGSVAEAAHLCSRGIKTRVLLSESNKTMLGNQYMKVPGAKEHLTVETLKLKSQHLSVERMLKLMAFSDQSGPVPLYMVVLQQILRVMAIEGDGASFDYWDFKQRLVEKNFTREQTGPLYLRLDLLESFMEAAGRNDVRNLFSLEPGTLTIIDLSDPFVDASTACVLFDICLSLAKANSS